jgi:hypothetical protein
VGGACIDAGAGGGTCPTGLVDCAGSCVDLREDGSNCGHCGTVCALAHSRSVCDAARCVVSSCDAGFDNCDDLHASGCETDLLNDPKNCGGCGNVCAGATCVAGLCR